IYANAIQTYRRDSHFFGHATSRRAATSRYRRRGLYPTRLGEDHQGSGSLRSDSAGLARSLSASVGVPHDFGRVAGRSSASFRRVYRMGKRSGGGSPANRHVYGPSPLWLQLHQNQSDRGWSGAIRTSGG